MRIIIATLFFGMFNALLGQTVERTYGDADTAYYLNIAIEDYKYYEDNNYYVDFSNINVPCYFTETISSNDEKTFTVNFHRESIDYFKDGGMYCRSEGLVADPYGHSELVEFKWADGYCDRFSSLSLRQSKDRTTSFTASYTDKIFPESALFDYMKDIEQVTVKARVRLRQFPMGKRELTTLGFKGVTELFRLEEEIRIESATLISKSGKTKSLKGFDLSKCFRQLTKRKFVFIEAETGQDKLTIQIKPFQQTIVESILLRIDQKPKNLLQCNGLNEKNIYLYPNPTFGDIYLKFDGYDPGQYNFVLYNIIGREIVDIPFELEDRTEAVKLLLPDLSKGTYLYAVKNKSDKRLVTRRMSIVNH